MTKQRWEYFSKEFSIYENYDAIFDKLGSDGWELVIIVTGAMDCMVAFFKKLKQAPLWAVSCRQGSYTEKWLNCNSGEPLPLTQDQYNYQLSQPDRDWQCPSCNGHGLWSGSADD